MAKLGFGLGCVESPPDLRDFWAINKMHPAALAAPLPKVLDLSPWLPSVGNQGAEGSCVGWAVSAAGTYGQNVEPAPGALFPDREILSPRFAYWGGRNLWRPSEGDGTQIRAALKWFQRRGALTAGLAPYTDGDRTWAPKFAWDVEASRNRIATYGRVGLTMEEIARALLDFGPLVLEVITDDGFNSPLDGVIKPTGPEGGRHAIVCAGYDLNRRLLLVRNSWGRDWGKGGYAWLPITPRLAAAWYMAINREVGPAWIPWHEEMAPGFFLEA